MIVRLSSIAESKVLRHHVRGLTIRIDVFTTKILDPSSLIALVGGGSRLEHQQSWISPSLAESVTLASFPYSQIPSYMKKQDWDSQRLFDQWQIQKEFADEQKLLMHASTPSDFEHLGVKPPAEYLNCLLNLSAIQVGPTGPSSSVDATGYLSAIAGCKLYLPWFSPTVEWHTFFGSAAIAFSPYRVQTLTIHVDRNSFLSTFRPETGGILPHFSSLTATFPMLEYVTTLNIECLNITGPHETALAYILTGLKHLQNLMLHGWKYSPNKAGRCFTATITSSLQCLDLSHCILDMNAILYLFERNSKTLKKLHLHGISLIGGHFQTFFNAMRDILDLDCFKLGGDLRELRNENAFFVTLEEILFIGKERDRIVARRRSAIDAIAMFVTRKNDHFPTQLLDNALRVLNPVMGRGSLA